MGAVSCTAPGMMLHLRFHPEATVSVAVQCCRDITNQHDRDRGNHESTISDRIRSRASRMLKNYSHSTAQAGKKNSCVEMTNSSWEFSAT
jgi:hypothetical protein